jgi:nucleoid DNA-binding protein
MKGLKPEDFFKRVSVNSGISDLRTIKDIYYGMVRTMSQELRDKHVVELPDWGEFRLKIQKSRKFVNVTTGQMDVLPPKPMVKFGPDYKVKRYFYTLGE